jgi:hypothetical protein
MRTLNLNIVLMSLALQLLFVLVLGEANANSSLYNAPKTNGYDLSNPEIQMKLAFVHTLLLQTRQKHSHQLNGQIDNQYSIRKTDGAEAVFDRQGNVVTHCANKIITNRENPLHRPFAHFSMDVWPWLKYGLCKIQTTTPTCRCIHSGSQRFPSRYGD